MDAEIIVIIVN